MNTHVNFETAKLLKEKGFDEKIRSRYTVTNWNSGFKIGELFVSDYPKNGHCIYAPTIAEVVMWLYEKHSIWISIDAGINGFYGHYKINPVGTLTSSLKQGWVNTEESPFNTPTEAYEAGIEHTLKHLI